MTRRAPDSTKGVWFRGVVGLGAALRLLPGALESASFDRQLPLLAGFRPEPGRTVGPRIRVFRLEKGRG